MIEVPMEQSPWKLVKVKVSKFRCRTCPKVRMSYIEEYFVPRDTMEPVEPSEGLTEGICDRCHKELLD